MSFNSRGFRAYDGNHAPKPPFVLNKDSPQAQNLLNWWPLIAVRAGPGGGVVLDYIKKKRETAIPADWSTQVSPDGLYGFRQSDTAADNPISLGVLGDVNGNTGLMSFMSLVRKTADVSFSSPGFSGMNAQGGEKFGMINVSGELRREYNSVEFNETGPSFADDEFSVVAVAFKASGANMYCFDRNGRRSTSDSVGTHDSTGFDNVGAGGIGGHASPPSAANRIFNGWIYDTRNYDGTTPEAIVHHVYDNPWDLYHELNQVSIYLPITAVDILKPDAGNGALLSSMIQFLQTGDNLDLPFYE